MRSLLNAAYTLTAQIVDGEAVAEGQPDGAAPVDVSILLSQTGDRPRRKRLACHLGTGAVVVGRGGGWLNPAVGGTQGLHVALFDTAPDDVVVLAASATVAALRRDAAYFLPELRKPTDIPAFAWLLASRTSDNADDRTAVCVWDGRSSGAEPRWERNRPGFPQSR